jgi:hypothetical protein
LFQLLFGGLSRLPVDLGHEKRFLPVPIAQSFPHADFAYAAVVVPTVIEEGDSVVECSADDANAFFLVRTHPEVITAESDQGDFLTSVAQNAGRERTSCAMRRLCS